MAIGPRIRAAREARGWTQFQLGIVLGRRDTEVSRWERGALNPRAGAIAEVAVALGVSADYLLSLTKEMVLDPTWTDRSAVRPTDALAQLQAAPVEEPAPQQAPRAKR
jgi:transcriptional regulator with XRE-family HTH domain